MANVANGKKKSAGKATEGGPRKAASSSKARPASSQAASKTSAKKATKASTIEASATKSKSAKSAKTEKASMSQTKAEKSPTSTPPPKTGKAPAKAASAVKATDKTSAGGDLKQRFAALASATGKISGLKRSLSKSFFDVGLILNQIRDERLYEVKGYGSFEAFVEREIDINKVTCLRSARIAEAMQREVALQAGIDRSSAAVAALDGEDSAESLSVRIGSGHAMPLVPLHKQ